MDGPSARRLLAALLVAQIVLGLAYSFATPIFEVSDEYLHYPVVREIAENGRLPVQQAGTPSLWEQEGSQPPLYYALGAAVTGWIDTGDYPAQAVANPFVKAGRPGTPDNVNLMAHPPGQSPAQGGTVLAVYLIRWLSVLMATATAALTYRIGRLVAPKRPAVALLAAALVAFNPMVLFINASVNNDNLLMLLSTLGISLLLLDLRSDVPGPRWRPTLVFGLVAGLAALTKLSGLILLPTAALSYTLVALRTRDWRSWVVRGATLGAVVFAVAGWWYLRNLRLYGEVTGLETMVAVAGGRPPGFGLAELLPEWRGFWYSYWGVFGAFNVLAGPWFYWLAAGLTLLGLGGLVVAGALCLRRRRLPARWADHVVMLAFLALTAAGLLRWTLQTLASQGRLLFGAVAVISFYLALGLLAWFPRRRRSPGAELRAATTLAAGLAGVAAIVAATAIAPAYRPAPPLAALPERAVPLDIVCDDQIALAGYEPPATTEAGRPLDVVFYWRALSPIPEDLDLSINVYGYREENVAKLDTWPGGGLRPTSGWQPGALYPDAYRLETEAAELPTLVRLGLAWNSELTDGTRNRPILCRVAGGEPLETVFLDAGALIGPPPDGGAERDALARLDHGLELVGAAATADGTTLDVTLTWRAGGPAPADYTVFAHLLDAAGQKVGQGDGPPRDGYWPTSLWRAGEVVESRHTIPLPAGLDPRSATVAVGLYDPSSGERLNATDAAGAPLPDRMIRLPLGELVAGQGE